MTIYFVPSQNQDIDSFQSYIQSKFKTEGFNINWLIDCVKTELPITIGTLFNQQNIDLAIIPSGLIQYQSHGSYTVLALIDSLSSKYAIVAKKENYNVYDFFGEDDLRKKYGKVFITGFGPGDPDLLTIKALKVIQNADVIFYDCLINKEFLDQFETEKIFVGKRKGNHSCGQDEIDEMLYQSAISGKNTVRLKGGDPFIFGRGGEEFDYLRKRFIDVEVIPGITAAFGAASSLGISLTQRLISSSVAFCTGFPKENRRIPDADTLVFYMSASNLQETARLLIKSGRSAETQVALIRNATLADQESRFSTLIELANGKTGLKSPMVAIVGDVAIDKN